MKLYLHPTANAYSSTFEPLWTETHISDESFFLLIEGKKMLDYGATRKMNGERVVLKNVPPSRRRKRKKTLTERMSALEQQVKKLTKNAKD